MARTSRKFHLKRELGTGSFGTVYLAEMVSAGDFKKQVAVKVLKPEVESTADAARRLRDEARMLGRLRHRNIVQVDDLVRLEGRWAVVMEHVEGPDLIAVLTAAGMAEGAYPVRAALETMAQVARALDAAYDGTSTVGGRSLRLIHRDIKPSNLKLTADGDVKVLDFGIARADFSEREARTGSMRFGSVPYMAPERFLGEPEVHAGDVYSMGCVLFELLEGKRVGQLPLDEIEREGVLDEKLAGVDERLPRVATLLREMLAWAPEERPAALEVANRLQRLAERHDSETLHSFARRFVPKVGLYVLDGSRDVDGLLEEEVDTLAVVAAEVEALPTSAITPVATPASPWRWPLIGLLLAALGVLIGWYSSRHVWYADLNEVGPGTERPVPGD